MKIILFGVENIFDHRVKRVNPTGIVFINESGQFKKFLPGMMVIYFDQFHYSSGQLRAIKIGKESHSPEILTIAKKPPQDDE
jgi:hypothetical protein